MVLAVMMIFRAWTGPDEVRLYGWVLLGGACMVGTEVLLKGAGGKLPPMYGGQRLQHRPFALAAEHEDRVPAAKGVTVNGQRAHDAPYFFRPRTVSVTKARHWIGPREKCMGGI